MMVPEINLLPKMERQKSNSILIIVIGLILFATVLLLFFIQYMSLKNEVNTLTAEETYVAAEKVDLTEQVELINTSNQGTLAEAVIFAESVSYPVSPLLIEVDALLEGNTYLRQFVFLEQSLEVSVDFETMTGISNYVEKLLQSDYFTDIKIEQISNFEANDDIEDSRIINFEEIPRYSATINLTIDQAYLSAGGDQP